MYMMKKESELDLNKLGKILSSFQVNDLPKLNRYYNYYLGKQNILKKEATDTGKPCNHVVVNYCSGIVENYTGYLVGKPVGYSGAQADFDKINDCLNYNDVRNADSQLLMDACIFGRSAEIMWIDEWSQTRFKPIDPREIIAIYDDTLDQELLYAVRFYKNDYVEEDQKKHIVEVYDSVKMRKYITDSLFGSFTLIEEKPHFFGMVPVTFFDLNKEQTSIFDRVMSLQDAYNTMVSSSIDDWESFCDAYLLLKGVVADADDLIAMKENRVLMLDTDASAEYLTKNSANQNSQDMLQLLNDQIHVIALSPDFNDDKFMAQSGIALRYKLIGFENMAGSIENNMKKALQRRIELICGVLNLKGGDAVWRDVEITFTRNLPTNDSEMAQMVNQLRGIVSNETLIAQLPFVDDPKEELEKVKKQKEENIEEFSFSTVKEDELLATETDRSAG